MQGPTCQNPTPTLTLKSGAHLQSCRPFLPKPNQTKSNQDQLVRIQLQRWLWSLKVTCSLATHSVGRRRWWWWGSSWTSKASSSGLWDVVVHRRDLEKRLSEHCKTIYSEVIIKPVLKEVMTGQRTGSWCGPWCCWRSWTTLALQNCTTDQNPPAIKHSGIKLNICKLSASRCEGGVALVLPKLQRQSN